MTHAGSHAAHAPLASGQAAPATSSAHQEPGPPHGTPSRQHHRSFVAVPDQVRQARNYLAGILGDCPAASDAVVCLSELAANAVTHSNSRTPGGRFTVRVTVSHQRLRVEVHDDGGPWTQNPGTDPTSGRGLIIVSHLALAWGRAGHSHTGWNVWFEIDHPHHPHHPHDPEETP